MTGPTREEVEEWATEADIIHRLGKDVYVHPHLDIGNMERFAALAFAAGARSGEDAQKSADIAIGYLKDIGDWAHGRSTGPTVPDDLWEVRRMAYEGMDAAAIDAAMGVNDGTS